MPGGVINTGSHPKALWPGVHAFWGQVYNELPTEYVELYDQEDSTKAYEEDSEISGFSLATVKAEGASVSFDSEVAGPTQRYTHVAYGLGYIVTYEELQDNLYETVSFRRSKANAFSMNQTVEIVSAIPYNSAFSGTTFVMADGQTLVSTAHVNAAGGTYSNALSPAADLCEASIEDITIQIMGVQTSRGLNFSAMPQSLHVARQEWYNANRILQSVLQSGGTNNDINVLKATNALPKGIKMNHFFTSAHAWFVRTNVPNGMTMFWREKPNFDQDNDFPTKNAMAAGYMRFSLGCTDARGIFGSNGP